MDRTELRLLLEDLLMMRAGHRNVTEEHLEGAWLAIGGGSGYSIDGLISEADFKGWLATHGLQVAHGRGWRAAIVHYHWLSSIGIPGITQSRIGRDDALIL